MRVRDVMTYGAIGVSEETNLAEGLEVIAENTPGVVAVHDHMRWIEPNSGFVPPSEENDQAQA
jgi:hypothetical protein